METEAYRSGYIAIVGRPNVGKSTLLNKLLGYKVAITSPKPQTTRNRILGIKTVPGAQMLFVDTPGIHKAERPLNRYMTQEAMRALSDVDVILLLIEADGSSSEDDSYIIENLRETKTPVLLVINKIDSVPKPSLLSLMDRYATLYPFQALIPASALTGDGLDILEKKIIRLLPLGPQYFPEDQVTDVPERFLASELVREKVFNMCGEEIPYAVAVVVEEFKERTPPKPVYVRATVYVEKESQKGILIGAQGRMLKKIGQAAREDLQGILGRPVYLELWVKVEKNWSRDERGLRKMGYR